MTDPLEPYKNDIADFTRSVKGRITWPMEMPGMARLTPLSIQWERDRISRLVTIQVPPDSMAAEFFSSAYVRTGGKLLQRSESVTHTLGSAVDFRRFLEEAGDLAESFKEESLVPSKRKFPWYRVRVFLRSPLGEVRSLYNKCNLAYLHWQEARRQKAISEPRRRGIYFKLPLKQTEYHWEFKDRKAFLSGRLSLTLMSGEGLKTSIPVVADGGVCEGWKELGTKQKKSDNDIYFGFYSTKKFLVTNRDAVTIELELSKDVPGIGPLNKGVLKAGVYSAATGFTIYETNGRAYTGDKNCKPLWDLEITDNRGWMADRKVSDQ